MTTLNWAAPPGPLEWLFPELEEVDSALQSGSLLSPSHVDAALSNLPDGSRIRTSRGPRGRVFARALRQKLRGRGMRVEAADGDLESGLIDVAPSLCRGQVWEPMPGVRVLPLRPEDAEAEIACALEREDLRSIVPIWLTLSRGDDVTTRLGDGFWGLLPGDHLPGRILSKQRELMRRCRPSAYLWYRALEGQALAGFDPLEDLLYGRRRECDVLRREARDHGAVIIGIDGIDGAGKSSQIDELRTHLESLGLDVGVHKIYRHGVFHETVTDMTRSCAGRRNLHLWRLQRHIKLFDSLKYYYEHVLESLERNDVLIFDRYIQTHLAAGLGRYGYDPYAREMLAVYPAADRVFVLDLPEDIALRRLAQRESLTVDENPYMLGRFRAALLEQVNASDVIRLDARRPIEHNGARIREEVMVILESRG